MGSQRSRDKAWQRLGSQARRAVGGRREGAGARVKRIDDMMAAARLQEILWCAEKQHPDIIWCLQAAAVGEYYRFEITGILRVENVVQMMSTQLTQDWQADIHYIASEL